MYGILISALFTALGFMVRSTLVKFATFFALFFIVSGFISYLAPLLPNASGLTGALGNLTSGAWYFLDLFKFPFGLSSVLSAYVLRFMIRRMPVIG
jgi:hypothetical protein